LDARPHSRFFLQTTEEPDLWFGDDLELGFVLGHP
jgi:hypothetical protein